MSFVDLLYLFFKDSKLFFDIWIERTEIFVNNHTTHGNIFILKSFENNFPCFMDSKKGIVLQSQDSIKNCSHCQNFPQNEQFFFVSDTKKWKN